MFKWDEKVVKLTGSDGEECCTVSNTQPGKEDKGQEDQSDSSLKEEGLERPLSLG